MYDFSNTYATHPVHLGIEPSGDAYGVFFLNSNAMDIVLSPAPAITYRTIGGLLEFFVYLGPSPDAVVQQHVQTVGLPYMPPYWALGFHLCRWGYGSANNTRAVWEGMMAAGVPQDTQWNDIDYMRAHLGD